MYSQARKPLECVDQKFSYDRFCNTALKQKLIFWLWAQLWWPQLPNSRSNHNKNQIKPKIWRGSIIAWFLGRLVGRLSRSEQFWCYSGLWRCWLITNDWHHGRPSWHHGRPLLSAGASENRGGNCTGRSRLRRGCRGVFCSAKSGPTTTERVRQMAQEADTEYFPRGLALCKPSFEPKSFNSQKKWKLAMGKVYIYNRKQKNVFWHCTIFSLKTPKKST